MTKKWISFEYEELGNNNSRPSAKNEWRLCILANKRLILEIPLSKAKKKNNETSMRRVTRPGRHKKFRKEKKIKQIKLFLLQPYITLYNVYNN